VTSLEDQNIDWSNTLKWVLKEAKVHQGRRSTKDCDARREGGRRRRRWWWRRRRRKRKRMLRE